VHFEVVRTVTGVLTSPARLVTVERIQRTKSGVLNTVSPSKPGASAQPLSRSAAQPHGGSLRAKGPCKRPTNALASARTFGAKHSRGLPPNR